MWIWRMGTGFVSKNRVMVGDAEVQREEAAHDQGIYSSKRGKQGKREWIEKLEVLRVQNNGIDKWEAGLENDGKKKQDCGLDHCDKLI